MKKVIIGINLIAVATPVFGISKSQISNVKDTQIVEQIPTTGKVNVNFATKEQIAQKAKVSLTIASAIVEYRKEHGIFKHVDELIKVKGIGPATLEKIKPYVQV